jgi:hypothetical protein
MYEYVAFNPYNSSPEALATELTKKSAEGWEVVNIVPTFDGRYCAFLRRPNAETGTTTSTYTSTTTPFPSTTQTATTSSAAPAAWYPDPSKRFELRYWDGSEWTEHVARGGQQFTDQPVA